VCNDIELQNREVLRVERDFSVAAIDDITYAGQPRVGFLDKIDDLEYRSACRYHILHRKDTLARVNLKSPPQLHFAVFSLCKNRSDLKHSTNFGADHDAPDGWRDDQLDVGVFKMFRNLSTEKMQVLGILKHLGALEILVAVETGCKLKMPFKKGLRLAENVENLLFWKFHGAVMV
jgi:hypothetical protein